MALLRSANGRRTGAHCSACGPGWAESRVDGHGPRVSRRQCSGAGLPARRLHSPALPPRGLSPRVSSSPILLSPPVLLRPADLHRSWCRSAFGGLPVHLSGLLYIGGGERSPGLCRAAAVLVLLPERPDVLPIRQRMPGWVAAGRPTTESVAPVKTFR